jgi:hypothetical protein
VEGVDGKWEKVCKLKSFAWKQLRHNQVGGGVTDGSSWVGCIQGENLAPALDPNFRCLEDILSPVQAGLPLKTPPLDLVYWQKDEPKVLMHNGMVGYSSFFPYGKAKTQVYALSAFGQCPGWITRCLPPAEWAVMYNFLLGLQKSNWLEEGPPFLVISPCKGSYGFSQGYPMNDRRS